MKFTIVAASAFAATVSAQAYGYGYQNSNGTQPQGYNGPYTTTEVVTAYTTYCPYATTFTEGSQTYTVTEPTTITVTNCPCTRTYTYQTSVATSCPGGCAATTPVAPPQSYTPTQPASSYVPPVASTPVYTPPKANVTTPAQPPPATNGASRATFASGALAVMVGLAACLL